MSFIAKNIDEVRFDNIKDYFRSCPLYWQEAAIQYHVIIHVISIWKPIRILILPVVRWSPILSSTISGTSINFLLRSRVRGCMGGGMSGTSCDILNLLQYIEAASGSKAITSCSGWSADANPAWKYNNTCFLLLQVYNYYRKTHTCTYYCQI